MSITAEATKLKTTPLDALHRELGAKMVPFSGYDMPVHYPAGILKEHLHTRAHAGLFDVSHMGQLSLRGGGVVKALEKLVPGDIEGLAETRTRYTQFTTESGGIIDDLMVTRIGPDALFLVVNAGTKHGDIAHLKAHLPPGIEIEFHDPRALLALQGPDAAHVLSEQAPELAFMPFMSLMRASLFGIPVIVTRSGYTGEDGYEISVAPNDAEVLARRLLADERVLPIGLGARDSLRLEAGLCLYGHDIDLGTTPVEADLAWSIGKRRREAGGFMGDTVICAQLRDGPPRVRVGLALKERVPAREGAEIFDAEANMLGTVTSGGFSPSLDRPIAMAYVVRDAAKPNLCLGISVRGRQLAGEIVAMPFVPTRYYRSRKD